MSAKQTLAWGSTVEERTERELAKSLRARLSNAPDNADEDVKAAFQVTISVKKRQPPDPHK